MQTPAIQERRNVLIIPVWARKDENGGVSVSVIVWRDLAERLRARFSA